MYGSILVWEYLNLVMTHGAHNFRMNFVQKRGGMLHGLGRCAILKLSKSMFPIMLVTMSHGSHMHWGDSAKVKKQ